MKKIISISLMGLGILGLVSCDSNLQTSTTSSISSESKESQTSHNSDNNDHKTDVKIGEVYLSNYYEGSYYGSVNDDLSNLKKNLNVLINTGFKSQSYSSDSNHLKTIDSYDGNYVECFYTGLRLDKEGISSSIWNKEHVWAKSLGFGDQKFKAYSDLHHLRATQTQANSVRANKYFAEGGTKSEYGYSSTSTTYEPRDEVKGDVARMIIYMTVMYDDFELDLELTNDTSKIQTKAGGEAYIGLMDTLLKWNMEDPVDSREIKRNEDIYTIQGNRNPFIDHPAYSYYLYKDEYERLGYSIEDAQNLELSRTLKDEQKLNQIESLIKSIPQDLTTSNSVEFGTRLEEALSLYDTIDDETKSFIKSYDSLISAEIKWENYQSLQGQDTTISTTFNLSALNAVSGNLNVNGVALAYKSFVQVNNNGIYVQKAKPLTIDVSNLYNSLKTFKIDLKTNNSNVVTSIITITDGTNTITDNLSVSTTKKTYSFDLSKFDLSKELKITITNETGKSVLVSSCSFNI